MNTNRIFRLFAASALVLGTIFGCTKDEQNPANAVAAGVASLTFEATGAEPQLLPVYADGSWTMECDADWITFDHMSFYGSKDITVTVTDNVVDGELDFPRHADVFIKSASASTSSDKNYKVTIYQEGNKFRGVKDITVSEAINLDDERVASVPHATVMAIGDGAFIASDGKANILVIGQPEGAAVGSDVMFVGDKSSEFGVPSVAMERFAVNAAGEAKLPEAKAIDVDNYTSTHSDYITVDGSLVEKTIRFADKKNRIDVVFASADLNLASLNRHKVSVTGYYVGKVDANTKNDAIIVVSIKDGGEDESLIPYPVKWAMGAGAASAGVLNYTTESFAATNKIDPIQGFGYISYIPACEPALDWQGTWDSAKEIETIIGNGNNKYARDIQASNPRITGTWPGDFWLFCGDGAIKAGSKVQVKFESRVSATNHMFWQIEYYDGEVWKVAGDVQTTDVTGETITYTHSMNPDAATNVKVDPIVTFNHNNEHCYFRFRCMANWQANGTGPLAARNGGTGRLSVNDTGETGVEWWPSITIIEEGDGVDRPDVDPVMANIITNPDYLAFEGKPAAPKTLNITSDYDFTLESTVDWITLDVTSGVAGEKTAVTVTCEESVSSSLREGKIVISSADSKKSVPVIQSAAGQDIDPMISIDANYKTIDYKGQVVKVKVQSTVDYTVTPDVDWIALTPDTKTLVTKDEVSLYILENASETETRTGHVVFANTEKGIESVLTIEQGVHPGVPAIFEDDFSWLDPFIAMYNSDEANGGKKIGDTVGAADKNANAPNAYTAAPFSGEDFWKAFADKGYTDLNPSDKLIYPQDAYLKFSRTGGHNTGIQLSLEKYMSATQAIDVSFDFSMMIQGDGTVDAGPVCLVIAGNGTFADGTKIASFTSAQETNQLFWNKAKATILGADSSTKLTFMLGRVIKEDGTYNWNVSGAGRFFLDNILIVPGESPIVYSDDFSWLSPAIKAYNEAKPAAPCSDWIYGTYDDLAARIKYSNDNSFNLNSTVEGWADVLANNGYVHLHPQTYCQYAQGTPENPYMKFCKGNTQDGLSFQPFRKAYDEVTLSFDWAIHMTNSALDAVNIQIVLEGAGEFENGTKTSDPVASGMTEVADPFFTNTKFVIKNVNASTVVKICCKEGFDGNFATSGQHRYYIDNILIVK